MGNKHNRHPVLITQLEQHIKDRGTRAGIHHGGGLIGDQHFRMQHEDPRNH
ncbi:hypothetical protein D3C76_1598780 [compost metagenome]